MCKPSNIASESSTLDFLTIPVILSLYFSRFGIIEGEEEKSAIYTLANPTGVARRQKTFLQQWIPEDGSLKKVVMFDECLAALAVRDDGRFVAVGTMFSGSVCIYIAFSLQVNNIIIFCLFTDSMIIFR